MTEFTVWQLARMAGCADPDSPTSEGADFLKSVAEDVADRADSWDDDAAHEIADGAVPVYTHARWLAFVDLAAWNEDVTEYGAVDGDDLTRSVAGVALYMIADRLVWSLREAAEEDDEEEEEPETDES